MSCIDLSKVKKVAIYPAIGVARVGNSPQEFFIGPTAPGTHPDDPHDFRDSQGRIKRQGAKFVIYGLDRNGNVLGEIDSGHGAKIDWRVEVANKKAAWYNFDLALDIPAANGAYDAEGIPTPDGLPLLSQRRNRKYRADERKNLMIEPKGRSIEGRNKHGRQFKFDDGKINGKPVYLGELRTDEAGCLIFLGGHGKSAAFEKQNGKPVPLTTFANNEGWHDDTSDGPVDATVTLPDGRALKAEGAWVVTAPPNFAVGVQAFSTGYDLLSDVAWRSLPKANRKKEPSRVEFYRDIYPMLKHLTINQWVNAGVQREFGWGSAYDFDHEAAIARSSDPSEANRPFRQTILESFRNPDYQTMQALAWPPLYGDAVTFNSNSADPRNWFAVTELQYANLPRWAVGDFCVGEPRDPDDWENWSPGEKAEGVTEAALEETLGGPFHPGCEFTWPMRHAMMYRNDTPFRIKRRKNAKEDFGVAIDGEIALSKGGPLDGSSPGDVTKWMAVPWQSDTSSCLSAYRQFSGEYLPTFWPARVPNDVLTEQDYKTISSGGGSTEKKIQAFAPGGRKKWLRGFIFNSQGQFIGGSSIQDRIKGVTRFTHHWGKIGILVKKRLKANHKLFPRHVWVETGRQMPDDPVDKNGKLEKCSDRPAWVEANPRHLR